MNRYILTLTYLVLSHKNGSTFMVQQFQYTELLINMLRQCDDDIAMIALSALTRLTRGRQWHWDRQQNKIMLIMRNEYVNMSFYAQNWGEALSSKISINASKLLLCDNCMTRYKCWITPPFLSTMKLFSSRDSIPIMKVWTEHGIHQHREHENIWMIPSGWNKLMHFRRDYIKN